MFQKKMLKKRPRMSQAKFSKMFNSLLLRHMREDIEKFIIRYHCTLTEIVFQCDTDCTNFAKDNGLGSYGTGHAYILADLVAWLNNNGKEPAGVLSMDLTDTIEAEMKKPLPYG